MESDKQPRPSSAEPRETLLAALEEAASLELEDGQERLFREAEGTIAEHVRAAEGVMTFPSLNGGGTVEPDPWIRARLEQLRAEQKNAGKS